MINILSFDKSLVKKGKSRKTFDRDQRTIVYNFIDAAMNVGIYACSDQIIDLSNIEIDHDNTDKKVTNDAMEIIF